MPQISISNLSPVVANVPPKRSQSATEDVDARVPAVADHVRQADLRPLDLALSRLATQVGGDLVDSRDPRHADRVPLRENEVVYDGDPAHGDGVRGALAAMYTAGPSADKRCALPRAGALTDRRRVRR